MAARKRMLREYKDFVSEEFKVFNLTLIDPNDLYRCNVTIIGPEGYRVLLFFINLLILISIKNFDFNYLYIKLFYAL